MFSCLASNIGRLRSKLFQGTTVSVSKGTLDETTELDLEFITSIAEVGD